MSPSEAQELLAKLDHDLHATPRRTAAGIRNLLTNSKATRNLATASTIAQVARQHLGPRAFPVRGILFDKSPSANWLVPFHQDISIPVRERMDVRGYGPWSIKEGVPHVQPPRSVLERMLTIRLHLDDVDEANGPLVVFPGSHANGILDEIQILNLQKTVQSHPCLARRGDPLLMRPLLVHGSSKAVAPARRRVLHIEYAAGPLPSGLDWAQS